MVIAYLFWQFLRRWLVFFRRWYYEASLSWWLRVLEKIRALERIFAVKINARLWFQPLYGDYSAVGRVFGPIFRTGRILAGLGLYFFIFYLASILWISWLSLLPFIIYKAIFG